MIHLAIEILWFILGVIICGGCVWVGLYTLRQVFAAMPAMIDKVVWGVFGILCLIYLLGVISGNAEFPHPALFR